MVSPALLRQGGWKSVGHRLQSLRGGEAHEATIRSPFFASGLLTRLVLQKPEQKGFGASAWRSVTSRFAWSFWMFATKPPFPCWFWLFPDFVKHGETSCAGTGSECPSPGTSASLHPTVLCREHSPSSNRAPKRERWCLQGGLGSPVPGGAAPWLSEQLSSRMAPSQGCAAPFQRALLKTNSPGNPHLISKDSQNTSRQRKGRQGNGVLRGCRQWVRRSRDHRVPLGSALAEPGGGNTLNIWQMSALGGCSLLSKNAKVSVEGQGKPSLDLPSHPGLPFPFFLF